jgi:multidrug resistance efflux pump
MALKKLPIACIGPASVLALAVALGVSGCTAKPADPPSTGATAPAASNGAPGQGAPGAHVGGQGSGRRFATIPVQAVAIHIGPLTARNQTAGSVVPVTQSAVASQVAGVVSRLVHQAGDWVKAGATVVQLDDSQLRLSVQIAQSALQNAKINYTIGSENTSQSNPKLALQVDSAQSALASAQKNYDSQKAIFDIGGISGSQLDTANSLLQQAQANVEAAKTALDQNQKSDTQTLAQLKLAIDQAQNQLQLAQLNLQNAAIKAPFAGQIAAVNVTPGSAVSLNTAVFVLVSQDKEINFTMPPADAPSFKVGDPVTFAIGGKTVTVRIAQAPSAPIGGVVPMVANVPAGAPAPYGAVGTISYKLTLAAGTLVPIAALQTRADQNFVYLVENGKAVEQPVTIVAEAGTTAVLAGVKAGQQVIVSPPPGLLAGSTVQVVVAQGQGAGQQGGNGTPKAGQGAGQ